MQTVCGRRFRRTPLAAASRTAPLPGIRTNGNCHREAKKPIVIPK